MSRDPIPLDGPDALPVLWLDNSCLVVDKPSGISTQAPAQFDSVESRVRRWLTNRAEPGTEPYLALPHRLDRCTSGVLLMALRAKAARKISRQFERREINKKYWAIVQGNVSPPSGTWRDCIRKVVDEPRAEIVTADVQGARESVLDYRVVASHPSYTWLELQLHTGRMHQIRVQAAVRTHPVVGDLLYGADIPFGPAVADVRERWIALHAHSLGFRHPSSGNILTIQSAMPSHWQELVG